MEVSSEIKEDIRKTQSNLKNAIRIHQVWVARLREDENNTHLRSKVREAEKEIIAIGHSQKAVVERLRRELELYQQRLKARNKQVNIEHDNRYVAQQIRDHQLQYRSGHKQISLLKPSVFNEIRDKPDHNSNPPDLSDSETDGKSLNDKENSNCSENDDKDKYDSQFSICDRNNFDDSLKKVKDSYISTKAPESEWSIVVQRSDSDSSPTGLSPSPSPPPLPQPGENISQETFLRLIGLVTLRQKELLEKKRNERRKRSTTSTNRTDYVYGNYDMAQKRKKYNQFPYLQTHTPPQTRSAKLRKQQKQNDKSSREGSPSGSSSDNKGGWGNGKPAWAASLPASLSVEPVYPASKKACHQCGRSDVPSILVWCSGCGIYLHTGCCDDGRCGNCNALLPDPSKQSNPEHHTSEYKDKVMEREHLKARNVELSVELRRLEARAATLRSSLAHHHQEKRQLLADQIETQRHLQRLLDFIGRFKETSVTASLTVSEAGSVGSDLSRSNDD